MKLKNFFASSILLLSVIGMASCGGKSEPTPPTPETATITVIDGTGSGTYTIGTEATITADEKEGKIFKEWRIDNFIKSTSNPYTFVVTKDETYKAYYTDIQVNITVENGTGSGKYAYGDTVTAIATIPEGKEFVNWTIDGEEVSKDPIYTFEAKKDLVITANTKNVDPQEVTITVVNGTGSGTYTTGQSVTVVASIPKGKEFVNWTIDEEEVSKNSTYTFTATKSLTIVANFKNSGMGEYAQTLTMTGDEFTVLNLTDIQLHNGNTVDFTKYLIDSSFEQKKPDLIMVLGDTINDSVDYDADLIAKDIFDLIESYDTPWAVIFGNHDQEPSKNPDESKKSIGSKDLARMLLDKTKYPHCLYMNGPEEVEGLSNYMINIENTDGELVESFILVDSLVHGLNDTHIKFYEDCVNYVTELNDGEVVPSVFFDHIPLPEYEEEYDQFSLDEYHDVIGSVGVRPISDSHIPDMFGKFKELGSTRTMLCGHDHYNSYYTVLDGIKIGYALKSSIGDDADGNPYKYSMGGCFLTVDGVNEDKIEYCRVNDYEHTIEAHIENGFDYHYPQVTNWKGSGAKICFNIRLPDTGSVTFCIMGTNLNNPKLSDAIGSWNRLTTQIKLDAANKTVTQGTLTQIEGNLYKFEANLKDLELNTLASEKAHGDETARLIYFHDNDMEFSLSNIHMEFESIPETDQIDLSSAVITPIEDQLYQKGAVVKPQVEVKLNGTPLKEFDDINLIYRDNRMVGTATVKIIPSGLGAHRYKGSTSTTFNIVGNPYRGEQFERGYTYHPENIPLTDKLVFDIHFTNPTKQEMWFMLGEGWDNYFGYYGLYSDGSLDQEYPGITVQPTEDEYFRVTCDLSKLVTVHSKAIPTTKIDLFYIRDNWGGAVTGYIDFDLSDAPGVLRGDLIAAGADKDYKLDNLTTLDTFVFDFKFTNGKDKYIYFMIGNSADGWAKYNGYYKFVGNGTIDGNSDGISITATDDGYYRVTLVLSELTLESDKGSPDTYNLFYIRGGWSNASGYLDINPQI